MFVHLQNSAPSLRGLRGWQFWIYLLCSPG